MSSNEHWPTGLQAPRPRQRCGECLPALVHLAHGVDTCPVLLTQNYA